MSERYAPYVVSDPERMGGSPCFRGTRIPVWTVFDNLADGMTLDEIFEEWPSLDPGDVRAVIRIAGQSDREAA